MPEHRDGVVLVCSGVACLAAVATGLLAALTTQLPAVIGAAALCALAIVTIALRRASRTVDRILREELRSPPETDRDAANGSP